MNRDWTVLIFTFVALAMVAGYSYFWEFLKKDHYDNIPLTEVTWTYKRPDPLIWVLTDKCPNKRGELKTFLSCLDSVKSRTDI